MAPRHSTGPPPRFQPPGDNQHKPESRPGNGSATSSILASTTILHFSAGLVIAGIFSPRSRPDAQIGLNILAGLTAVGAVAAGMGIHGKNPLIWWLRLGVGVTPIGLYLTWDADRPSARTSADAENACPRGTE